MALMAPRTDFFAGVAIGAAGMGALMLLYRSWTKQRLAAELLEQALTPPPTDNASKSSESARPGKLSKRQTQQVLVKRRPKGVGVDLIETDIELTDVRMLPVAHLASYFRSAGHLNVMGKGITHDYNVRLGADSLILGDIVRKSSMPAFSRAYLRAGPRDRLFFEPRKVRAAIVTCGGLCPGLNNIIREVTRVLLISYGVTTVYGVRGGWWGFHKGAEPIRLTENLVSNIHKLGGTILGSARGGFDVEHVLSWCKKHGINQLYVVGGDGTHRAANKVGLEAIERRLHLSVAGIPKTIDNDIDIIDRSFGFNSAVAAAQQAITSAKIEATCNVPNGIGIVKLMGRHAGFIAAHATLASGEVDLCLVPEVPIVLEGRYGCLDHLEGVLAAKGHAVVVVAEGAGEELCGASAEVDAGGNRKLPEIGVFLKKTITDHFGRKGTPVTVKYIDPSYMIRCVPASASDALFCLLLAQNAVHGAMAG